MQCNVLARYLRRLCRGPDFTTAVDDTSERRRRLHRGMRDMRQVVFRLDFPGCLGERTIEISRAAQDLPRLSRGMFQLGPVRAGIIRAVGSLIPLDLERVASLDRDPGIARDHPHAGERLECRLRCVGLKPHDLDDAGNLLSLR